MNWGIPISGKHHLFQHFGSPFCARQGCWTVYGDKARAVPVDVGLKQAMKTPEEHCSEMGLGQLVPGMCILYYLSTFIILYTYYLCTIIVFMYYYLYYLCSIIVQNIYQTLFIFIITNDITSRNGDSANKTGFSRLDIFDISRVANTNISSIFNYMS